MSYHLSFYDTSYLREFIDEHDLRLPYRSPPLKPHHHFGNYCGIPIGLFGSASAIFGDSILPYKIHWDVASPSSCLLGRPSLPSSMSLKLKVVEHCRNPVAWVPSAITDNLLAFRYSWVQNQAAYGYFYGSKDKLWYHIYTNAINRTYIKC